MSEDNSTGEKPIIPKDEKSKTSSGIGVGVVVGTAVGAGKQNITVSLS